MISKIFPGSKKFTTPLPIIDNTVMINFLKTQKYQRSENITCIHYSDGTWCSRYTHKPVLTLINAYRQNKFKDNIYIKSINSKPTKFLKK